MTPPKHSLDPFDFPNRPSRSSPDGDAIRTIAARPLFSLSRVQKELGIPVDQFIGAWDGTRPLPPEVRRRLLLLLDEARERLDDLQSQLRRLDAEQDEVEGT